MDDTGDTSWNSSTTQRHDQQTTVNTQREVRCGNLTGIVPDTEREQPRRYRIKKRHWQPGEDTLGEVIEQELLAWREPLDNQNTCRTVRPVINLTDPEVRQISSNPGNVMYSNVNAAKPPVSPQDGNSSIHGPPHTTSNVKRSYFLEGSMNKASKGTASVWSDVSSEASISSRTRSALSEAESGPSTPTNAPSSRMSISSSIDINEFKPLPPTPTTFKATMKRIGHKFKAGDSHHQQQKPDATVRTLRTPRKGLRKSISTWKFFDSTASEADDEGAPNVTKNEYKTIRDTASSRTLKLLGRRTQQPQVDQSVALLDERKRKAEIAYAEQFGNSKKKQKPDFSSAAIPGDIDNEFESRTVRHRSAVFTPSVLIPPSEHAQLPTGNTEALPLPLALSQSPSHSEQQISHHRNSSRDSTSTLGSDRDRRKRISRSELEKENQHLRDLLRQRDRQSRLLGTSRQSSPEIVFRTQDADSRESSPQRDELRAALSSHPVGAQHAFLNSQVSIPNNYVGETMSQAEEAPPIPPLPPSLVGRGILTPITNKPVWSLDMATVERRGAVAPRSRTIALPRPLSLVMEGVEDDDNDFGDENDKEVENWKILLLNQQGGAGVKNDVKTSRSDNLKENWEWPEDFF